MSEFGEQITQWWARTMLTDEALDKRIADCCSGTGVQTYVIGTFRPDMPAAFETTQKSIERSMQACLAFQVRQAPIGMPLPGGEEWAFRIRWIFESNALDLLPTICEELGCQPGSSLMKWLLFRIAPPPEVT